MADDSPLAPIGLRLRRASVTALELIDLLRDHPGRLAFVSVSGSCEDQKWSDLRRLKNVTTYNSGDGSFIAVNFCDLRSISYPWDAMLTVAVAEFSN